MTADIHPVPTSSHNNWVCILCGKYGDSSDLLTHTGKKVGCAFHRTCLANEATPIAGKCPGCYAILRGGFLLPSELIERLRDRV